MLLDMFATLLSRGLLLCTALCACAGLLVVGCGGGGVTASPNQAVAIAVQPLSETVPVGEAATFSVSATGTSPLRYQWSENGVAIAGATGATYTTPAVQLAPGGSAAIGSFEVRVSNEVNQVTSNAATLTAGPRSPKPGDLRYLLLEQVNVPNFWPKYGIGAGFVGITTESITNAVGTPLVLGQGQVSGNECLWEFNWYGLPPGSPSLAMYYEVGWTWAPGDPTISSYLQSVAAPDIVIDSMDIQSSCVGLSWVQTAQAGGFDQRLETVPSGTDQQPQIQALAVQDGLEKRVITAVSFDTSGNTYLVSYGWTGDTTTSYEAQTYVAPASEVTSTATMLANEGYFISAFGGNPTSGYLLVGTRVKGDTLPRPINQQIGSAESPNPTLVVWLQDPSGVAEVWEQ